MQGELPASTSRVCHFNAAKVTVLIPLDASGDGGIEKGYRV